MNDLNEIVMEGRLVRDPVTRRMESGALLSTFKIASNTSYVDRVNNVWVTKTTFVLVECWKNVAESCAKHLNKGDCVLVIGKLKQSRWEKDRIKMEKTFIAADHVEFRTKAKHTAEAESAVEPLSEEETPTRVKDIGEEPDVQEQTEIEEEVLNETEE